MRICISKEVASVYEVTDVQEVTTTKLFVETPTTRFYIILPRGNASAVISELFDTGKVKLCDAECRAVGNPGVKFDD